MATKSLTTNYLTKLTNANHDGVTQQISDRLVAFTTDNQMLFAARQAVVAARQAEDTAFKRFSGKDFTSDDLKKEDTLEDKYMSTIRGILNGLIYLPEEEPTRRKAQLAVQVFKDFNFSTSESAKVKGELAEARKATDAAIRQAFDIVNALSVLQPSESLNALITVLLSIEERAKLYYISGASGAGIDKPNGGGTDNGGGDTPTPDPTPDPNNGGGGNNGGSGGFDTGD